MNLEDLVAKFAEAANLEGVAPVNGVWKFSADGNVFGVTSDDAGENVWLFGEIHIASPEKKDAILKAAMEANFFHRGTGGATFSLNPDSGALTLLASQKLDALDEEAFFAFMEKFVNSLSAWNGIAGRAGTQASSPQEEPAAQTELFMHHDFMRV